MLGWALILLVSLRGLTCDASAEASANDTSKVSNTEEISESPPSPVTQELPTGGQDAPSPGAEPAALGTSGQLRNSRPPRRRPRRPRGFYNDIRYRNPANNPYNPNSPYAFRGRPGQPPMANRQGYNDQYYDPYNQYYGYPGYAPVQPQAQQYYPYPYQVPQQAQAPPPQPQTPPPSEAIPDLYYVQKADSPDGQYQYKRVSVVQDSYWEGRGRRRPTRWPQNPQQQYGYPAEGYYNNPYDPYNRRPQPQPPQPPPPPPPPPPQQQYYQPYPYPQQYPPYYQYPRVPGGPRSRIRTGRPPLRSTALPGAWRLTLAPLTTSAPQASSDLITEPSGD